MTMKRMILAGVASAALLTLTAPVSSAIPAPGGPDGCDTVFWGFLGSQRRTICDAPIQADGSWDRKRSIWTPPHQVPLRTSCYGSGSYGSCTTYGGYFVPFSIDDQVHYRVTPDTILPDEPGHVGCGCENGKGELA